MSAIGTKRTFKSTHRKVQFQPESGHESAAYECPLMTHSGCSEVFRPECQRPVVSVSIITQFGAYRRRSQCRMQRETEHCH
jgi:hypothetical protein